VRAPPTAFTKPEREPTESAPKKPAVDDAYDDETFVVEAFANVCVPANALFVYVFGIEVDALVK
jgi:hypothetical protein